MTEETVTITKKEYDKLLLDSVYLGFLENWGVDNWPGCEEANPEFRKWKEENGYAD